MLLLLLSTRQSWQIAVLDVRMGTWSWEDEVIQIQERGGSLFSFLFFSSLFNTQDNLLHDASRHSLSTAGNDFYQSLQSTAFSFFMIDHLLHCSCSERWSQCVICSRLYPTTLSLNTEAAHRPSRTANNKVEKRRGCLLPSIVEMWMTGCFPVSLLAVRPSVNYTTCHILTDDRKPV